MKQRLSAGLALLAGLLIAALPLAAQSCPPGDGSGAAKAESTLTGTIRYHNELRQWLGLELDQATCGQSELQLTFVKDSQKQYRQAAPLSGCKATVTGEIEWSPTGYYSTEMYIADGQLKPDASCHPSLPPPGPSKAAMLPGIKSYNAAIEMDVSHPKTPMTGSAWRTDRPGTELKPWQAYADLFLTGGDVVWAGCRGDFHLETASVDGQPTKATDWVGGKAPLSPSEDRPSSITITCVKAAPAAKAH